MTEPQSQARKSTASIKRLARVAGEGVVGNAAWAVVILVVLIGAPFLKGDVPVWLFLVVLVLVSATTAFIASAGVARAERMRGARDEARKHESDALRQAEEIAEKSEAEVRELREQLVAAAGGQQAVSTRMQSIARQVDALMSTSTGELYGPSRNQVGLLVSLLKDFEAIAPDGDPVAAQLLALWRDSRTGHDDSSWDSSLQMLKARALSIGAEEALGQQH